MKCLTETADDAVTVVVVVGQRVPDQPPLDRADGHDEQTRVEGCQAAATRGIARVCEADGGNDEPAEDGADEDEERVRFGAGGPVGQDRHDVTLLHTALMPNVEKDAVAGRRKDASPLYNTSYLSAMRDKLLRRAGFS